MGTTAGGGSYKYGTEVQISATPNYGYKFTKWADGSTANPRTVTVTGAKTYVAVFEQSEFGVTVVATPAAGGSASGGGTYKYLSTATVSAAPATGYRFANWSIYSHKDKTTKTDNNQMVTLNIDQSYTCTAKFTKNNYTVKVETSGVSGANAYIVYNNGNKSSITAPYQSGFELSAPSISGYRFLGWKEKGANSYFSTALTVPMNIPSWNATYVACYENTVKTVKFYNYDGSLYATRQVNAGESLGSNMPGNPKAIGQRFGGWKDFGSGTKVYSDRDVYGSWSTCTNHRAGDCGVVHSIKPQKLSSHSNPGRTYECMCIVCADCGCYLTWKNNRWVKADGRNWTASNGSKIYISPAVWCIRHQWGACEGYKDDHSAGTYHVH